MPDVPVYLCKGVYGGPKVSGVSIYLCRGVYGWPKVSGVSV